jgi:hypothetical protein
MVSPTAMSNEELEELETDRETPGESEPDTALRWIDCFVKRVNSPTVVPGSPQLVDGTCDEDEFADPDAGGLDLSIVARRIRRWMIVGIIVGSSVLVGVYVPPEIVPRLVAVVYVVIVSDRPPNGESRLFRCADAVFEVEPQFVRGHRVVERPGRKGFEAFELGSEVAECAGVDCAAQRV